MQIKEKILKAVRKKGQLPYKGRPIRIIPNFSKEILKARRAWADVLQTIREHGDSLDYCTLKLFQSP